MLQRNLVQSMRHFVVVTTDFGAEDYPCLGCGTRHHTEHVKRFSAQARRAWSEVLSVVPCSVCTLSRLRNGAEGLDTYICLYCFCSRSSHFEGVQYAWVLFIIIFLTLVDDVRAASQKW